MKCYNSHTTYCYCEVILKNDNECPFIEIKKIIDEHKEGSIIYTDKFIEKVMSIFDKLEINTSKIEVNHIKKSDI